MVVARGYRTKQTDVGRRVPKLQKRVMGNYGELMYNVTRLSNAA